MRAKALHTVCLVCEFQFVMASVDDIKNVRITGEKAGETTFGITIAKAVDSSRADVKKLTGSIRLDDEESDRMSGVGDEDAVQDRLYGL